jgi:flagellar hook-associated protein 1 FlgK
MSLSQALSAALSGLRVSQSGLSLIATNVANADTAGYVRKTLDQATVPAGGTALGVRIAAVNRELDVYLQRQLRTELAGGAYTEAKAAFYGRLQQIYGEPGSPSTLETIFNEFTTALQALQTSPESQPARSGLLSAAQLLTQRLNGTSDDIQGLRGEAELGLTDSVRAANEAMQEIARLNVRIGGTSASDATVAALRDQRDAYIDQLSQLMDIRVAQDGDQLAVFTASGFQLVGLEASVLQFDAAPAMTPASHWDPDPALRSVGTIALKLPNGSEVDLIAGKAIRSGEIAALLEMRDRLLPQAQDQLDQLAAAMASALSDITADGSAVAAPPQAGFDLDLAGLQDGNRIRITYHDNVGNVDRTVTIVRTDTMASQLLPDSATSEPSDIVVGIDFAAGMASAVADLNTLLGAAGLQTELAFSNPAGTTLRVLDDGAPDLIDVMSASTTKTTTLLANGDVELPFFTDGTAFYTGQITASGAQSLGLSGRIRVNPALLADPSRLVVYETAPLTPPGDQARLSFIYDQLTSAVMRFSPQGGIGTQAAPFDGSLPAYMRQMISQQGDAAAASYSLQEGQAIVVKSLQQRFVDASGVNIDAEMAMLLKLQTAYSANARVMSTINQMFDLLLRI